MIVVSHESHDMYNPIFVLINLYRKILYLIFDYPHKHYTFKYFEV